MKKIITIALLSSVGYWASCQNSTSGAGNSQTSGTAVNATIPVADFEQKITAQQGIQLIDVRTPEEFAGGHIKNAVNIDIKGDDFDKELAKLDKSKPVMVYCLSGGRSSKAASKMKDEGFSEVYNLDGGIMSWKSAGKPVESGSTTSKALGMSVADLEHLVTKSKYVLVDFNAQWCEPCKKMMPILEALAERKKADLSLVKIDADANEALLNAKGISGIPYLELYQDGKLVWKHSGFMEEKELLAETKL